MAQADATAPDAAAGVEHRFLESNGIRMHIAEAGTGPLVLLLHGFPESWYSWRHQLAALAGAGYHAVAPDQRGYGGTERPAGVEAYTMFDLVGDVVGLLDALGEERAVVAGHDWGAPVAWNTALLRPDRVRGVAGLSVPFRPRGRRPPLEVYRQILGDRFYQVYFQEAGVAEAELEADVARTIQASLFMLSGEASKVHDGLVGDAGFLAGASQRIPSWATRDDIDTYARDFERTGFTAALNWYRNIDRNWRLMAPWQGALVTAPALYIGGDRDIVYHFPGGQKAAEEIRRWVPNLSQTLVLEGCGHWTQQERPDEVNATLLEFLAGIQGRGPGDPGHAAISQ